MRIVLLAVGRRMPAWVDAGFAEYAKRLSGTVRLDLKTVASGQRGKGANPANSQQVEGRRLIAAVPAGSFVVALDGGGAHWGSLDLAQQFSAWMRRGDDITLLVGGADGLSGECLAHAVQQWSLGPLTFPHALVRVMVAEQLYRAWTVLSGHPYHRA